MSAIKSDNTTHRKRLARRLAETTSIPYQHALAQVVAAADAGVLPSPLDHKGMDAALRTLTTMGALPTMVGHRVSEVGDSPDQTLGRWFVDIPKEYAKKDKIHPLWGRPVPEYAGGLIAVDTTGDQWAAQAAASRVLGDRGWAGITTVEQVGTNPDEVFARILDHPHSMVDEAGVADCLGCQFMAAPSPEDVPTGGVIEGVEVAQSATSGQDVTPPEPVTARPPLVFVAHEGNPVPRCTGTSWRGDVGKRTSVYGPGGYNRCVKADGHAPEQGGEDPMHVDEWGNVFRLQPKFRVLRHLTNAEMAEIARESGMHVASSFEREPIWHKPTNTLWMTKDKEMVKVSNVYESEDRVTAMVVYPVQPRTTVRSYPSADVARWSEPSPTQMRRYERAWGFDD